VIDQDRQQEELLRLYSELESRLEGLGESEALFRELANTAPVMIWLADPEGQLTFFNERWLEFVGRSLDEELGDGWQQNIHPDDSHLGVEHFLASVRSDALYEVEYRLRRADGEYAWVFDRGVPRFRPDGSLAGYVGVTVDIDDRKQAEEALRASEDRLRAIIEASPLAIVEVGADERVRLWNPAAEQLYGWTAEEVIGEPVPYVAAESRQEFAEGARRVRSGRVYSGAETVRQRRDGSLVAVEVSAAPMRDSAGHVTGHMSVFRDITERKRQERELQASRARIVQAGDSERRRLERNLHDGAQQRLVSISLALRLVQVRLDADPAGAREMLNGARDELGHAMEELRELARGLHPAILTQRGLGAAVRVLSDRASLPVEIAAVPDGRLPEPVEAAIYYLVAEALTNVAKYAEASEARVEITLQNGSAIVEISDDGIGGATPSSGSGLRGLADRVEALAGRMQLESPPGRGTRLRAEIPCQQSRFPDAAARKNVKRGTEGSHGSV
jgi:PAS domain S-box-containing protein